MKILLLIPTLEIGGAEKYVITMANNLLEKEHEVDICMIGKENRFSSYLHPNGKIISLGKNKSVSFAKLVEFISLIKKEKYEVIHSHLFKADFLNFLSSFFSKEALRITTEHSSSSRRKNYKIFGLLQKIIYSRFKIIIAISNNVKSHLVNWTGLSEKKFNLIYNGTNMSLINDVEIIEKYERLTKEKIVLGTIARLEWRKDLKTSIKAMQYLKENTNLNFVYEIYGDGVERKVLEDLIRKKNLNDIVLLKGYISNIENVIDDIDIHILPSVEEGFGISVIETMARGIPNVISDAGGLKEILEYENKCLSQNIFSKGDSILLAEKLAELMRNQELLIETAIKSKNIVREKYTIDTNLNKYINIITEMENV